MKARIATVFMAATGVCALAVAVHAQAADGKNPAEAEYAARLQPMNAAISGTETTGNAEFAIRGDDLSISVTVKGAPASITHWQHFHGFKDESAAACPTEAADVNGDGIIDLIETEPAAGTTMVPFDDDPAAMDVAHGTYPEASADGTYTYQKVVSLKALDAAFVKAFGDSGLDLDRRVIFVHGIVPDSNLPQSVASLGPIPADVTLPIACGKIERVK